MMKNFKIAAVVLLVSLPFLASANDDGLNQCLNAINKSPMVTESQCYVERSKLKVVQRNGKLTCDYNMKCLIPKWHPKSGYIFTGYFSGYEFMTPDYIPNLKFCLDRGFTDGWCNIFTHDKYSEQFRPEMVNIIIAAKSVYPGVECGGCDINDPNCSAINHFAPIVESQHHCRWDKMLSLIQDDRPNYKKALDYAKSMLEKHRGSNWQKMVNLLEK